MYLLLEETSSFAFLVTLFVTTLRPLEAALAWPLELTPASLVPLVALPTRTFAR